MDEFLDKRGCGVRLALHLHAFSKESQHVLVICRYQDTWLLTDHKLRGWEFPGGKIEPGETMEQAAIREVFEETGGIIDLLFPIGQYEVTTDTSSFIKTIFYGDIIKIEEKEEYLETNGPIYIDGNLLERRFEDSFSFIMKDRVIEKSVEQITREFFLTKNLLP